MEDRSSVVPGTSARDLDSVLTQSLKAAVHGPVLLPGDPGYDAARQLWNGMIDRHPGAIVRCSGTADVVAAVNLARQNNLLVAVRGGGHNAAGNAICDGGIVVDLSAMKGIWVDPASQTVRAQGGATWAEFDRETALHGLATTGGAISTTGIAGLTLGGGLGMLMRSYGMACDNLRSVEIVTADGAVRTASESQHPDLFWGVRGGGGNFGVVTSFEFQLHPVSTVLGGMLIHPMERAKDILQFYREFNATAPNALTAFAGLMTSPEGAPIVGIVVCYNGPIDEGERVLTPLRSFGPPLADMVSPMPYVQLQSMLDEAFPPGLQVYWRSDFLRHLDDIVIDTLIDQMAGVTSPLSMLMLEQFGGAVRDAGPNDSAFVHRDADYNVAIIARWTDPTGADAHISWARAAHTAIRPFATGTYVNYLGDEGDDRVRAAYGADVHARLVAVKNIYDPTNLFRLNQNIGPSI